MRPHHRDCEHCETVCSDLSHSDEAAHLRVWTDARQLPVEFEELNELRAEFGFLCDLGDEVVWTGGEFQGSFFGAKHIELLFVFQDSNVGITWKRVTHSKPNRLD